MCLMTLKMQKILCEMKNNLKQKTKAYGVSQSPLISLVRFVSGPK